LINMDLKNLMIDFFWLKPFNKSIFPPAKAGGNS
jgi:hypothetical protein